MEKTKCLFTDPPTSGKFVAFYSDGSGCALFMVRDNGVVVDPENEELSIEYVIEAGFSEWLPLPESFKYWFENN